MCDHKKIRMAKFVLPKKEFSKLSPKERKHYLMFTLMLRDLNLLQKCLVYSLNEMRSNEPFPSAKTTVTFFFLKTLISKIHEMKKFLDKNNILCYKHNFSKALKGQSEAIERFFSDKKVADLFDFIRNKFGFHYEYLDDIDSSVDKEMESFENIEIWLSTEDSGNEIFASSNAIMLKVIFSKMRELGFQGNEQELLDKLIDLSLKVARILRDFSIHYINEAWDITWGQEREIEIDAPSIDEICLPFIVKERKK